jgi:hypothetical protein
MLGDTTPHVRREKPPLGVMPKRYWYEQRIRELARAINDYVVAGEFEKPYWWSIELTSTLRQREIHLENLDEKKLDGD